MPDFFDFHTHSKPMRGVRAVVSAPERPADTELWSLELHPWHIHSPALPPDFAVNAASADAIGEAGLDRLRGADMALQQEMLHKILAVASDLDKTVIFHCVKAVPELLAAVKKYPRLRKVFHGFCGSTELFAELLRHGFVVSLGEKALRHPALTLPPQCTGHIGAESDGGGLPVPELYERISRRWGTDVLKDIDCTFMELFGK